MQKALAHGLICNTVRFDNTIYSATEKHHTGTDVYRLIHNAAPGNSSASPKAIDPCHTLSQADRSAINKFQTCIAALIQSQRYILLMQRPCHCKGMCSVSI